MPIHAKLFKRLRIDTRIETKGTVMAQTFQSSHLLSNTKWNIFILNHVHVLALHCEDNRTIQQQSNMGQKTETSNMEKKFIRKATQKALVMEYLKP